MPIIGAALIISGLYLLTVYVLENFQITKAMQFSFAAAGSILAFGLGEFVRKKIDQVGRALNAIGLVGGYLTIVSGSETFGVYPDTLMVPLFFALSLVNVGIGWYRKDQPLALMGVTAAFFSSAMVADRNLLLPALGSASTLIAMAITWRQRWAGAAVLGTVCSWILCVSLISLDSFLATSLDTILRTLLVTAIGVGWMVVVRRVKQDAVPDISPFVGMAFALSLTLWYRKPGDHSVVIAGGIVAYALSTILIYSKIRTIGLMALACSLIGFGLPVTLGGQIRDWSFFIQAILYCFLVWKSSRLFIIPFLAAALSTLSISRVFYEVGNDRLFRIFGMESAAFVGLMALLAFIAYLGMWRSPAWEEKSAEEYIDGFYWLAFLLPLVGYGVMLSVMKWGQSIISDSSSIPLGVTAAIGIIAGFSLQRVGIRIAAWAFILCLLMSLYFNEVSKLTALQKIGVFVVFGALCLVAASFYFKRAQAMTGTVKEQD